MKITPEWIRENKACDDGAAWGILVVGEGMELEELLPKFERADWLIWLLGKTGTPSKVLGKIAIICARHVLPFAGKNKSICEDAITTAEECLRNPTDENKDAATVAASVAYMAGRRDCVAGCRDCVAGASGAAAAAVGHRPPANRTAIYALANSSDSGVEMVNTVYAATYAMDAAAFAVDEVNCSSISVHKALCDKIREFLKKRGE